MENSNKIKSQSEEWENIFTDTTDMGLISKIYKEFTRLNNKKKPQITSLKNGQSA